MEKQLITLELGNKTKISYTLEEVQAIITAQLTGKFPQLPRGFTTIEVHPEDIDPRLFSQTLKDRTEEHVRRKIVYALNYLKEHPECNIPLQLAIPDNALILPEKKLPTIEELPWHYYGRVSCNPVTVPAISTNIDEFLKWAYQIQTGQKTFNEIAYEPDDSRYPRIVKNVATPGYHVYGGGRMLGSTLPVWHIHPEHHPWENPCMVRGAVPQFKVPIK